MKIECTSCGGTGVYCGCAEPKGTAVICLYCDGKGYKETDCTCVKHIPFINRKVREGVYSVSRSRGTFIFGFGATGRSIPYASFLNGLMP